MELDADILVVGAGVSGSAAAYTASRLGSKVTVCEEHRDVGEPSHCSGHVGIKTMKRLGLTIPSRIIENEIRGAFFYSPSNLELILERPTPVTWVLDRRGLDRHMADLASEAGASYRLGSRVEGLKVNDDGICRVRLRDGGQVSCNIVIDAEGCGWAIARSAGLPSPERSTILNSAQAYVDRVDDVDLDFVEVYFGSNYSPGFFAWIIPRRDGSAKVGLAVKRENPRTYLERFMDRHPVASKKLRHSKVLRTVYHPIPVGGPIRRTFGRSLLVVGDAASQVKPTTGGGIVFGITCGILAGLTAHEAISNRIVAEEFLSRYEKRWKRAIDFDLRVMGWLRSTLTSLPDGQVDKLFSMAQRVDLSAALSRIDDIDFQGRNMLRLLWDPRVLATTLYTASLALPSNPMKSTRWESEESQL